MSVHVFSGYPAEIKISWLRADSEKTRFNQFLTQYKNLYFNVDSSEKGVVDLYFSCSQVKHKIKIHKI